jgi:hypothetical protein
MVETQQNTSDMIRTELEKSRAEFHATLNSMTLDTWNKQSRNPAWTNGEVMFHIMFAYMLIPRLWWILKFFTHLPKSYSKVFAAILTFFTPLYHFANKNGPRGGAKIYKLQKLGKKYDKVHKSILRKLNSMKPEDFELGMYYPQGWDKNNFKEYMTMEDLFLWSTLHFKYHFNRHLSI